MRQPVIAPLVTSSTDESERDVFNHVLDLVGRGSDEVVEVVRGDEHVVLPPTVVEFLRSLLEAMNDGDELVLVRNAEMDEVSSTLLVGTLDELIALAGTDMTSQQVADLLKVSRPYVVKLARTGKLPHVMVGNRHRFRMSDVVTYSEAMKAERADALRELAPAGGYDTSDF